MKDTFTPLTEKERLKMANDQAEFKEELRKEAIILDRAQSSVAFEAYKAYCLVMGEEEDVDIWAGLSHKKRGAFYCAVCTGMAELYRQRVQRFDK